MKLKFYLSVLCMFLLQAVVAQTVSGVITDENGDPMYGVNVVEKGTTNGDVSDFDGKYSFTTTTESPTLVFKFIGYRDKEVTSSAATVNMQMETDQIGLDQVVISASKRKERLLDAPASISVLKSEQIENAASITVADNLKSVPGVDVMPTGLVSQNVAVRGFNNIFSGGMLTLVDHRIGSVPSLKVNAFQLIPTNNIDIEKIEVVRGPGSALYGPNASDGVMHIITKSPMSLDGDHNAETTLGVTAGWRSVVNPEFHHMHRVNDHFGYKISGAYMQGHDFDYTDPAEPNYGNPYTLVNTIGGTRYDTIGSGNFKRDNFIQKYNADARFDFTVNKDIDITVNGGYTNTSNVELTGLGAAQGVNWGYLYGQARFRWKSLYVNYFMNASNSGDTYIYERDNQEGPNLFVGLLDKSKLHGLQLQHSSEIKETWKFIYGADLLMTRPKSDGTIYGVYEDESDINQFGLYGQAEWAVHEKFTILAALRGDYQTPLDEFNISPRAAFVYKPTPRHTLRATYNRAFSTPSSLNLALDLPQTFVPNGIVGKGFGNPNGFEYMRDANGNPMYISPYDGQWYSLDDNTPNYANFNATTNMIGAVLGETLGAGAALGQTLMGVLLTGVDSAAIANTPLIVTDFNTHEVLDPTTITDKESVKSTITQTVELGYKGIIADKLFLSTDLYFSNISNFTSPLTSGSYRVQFDPNALAAILAPNIAVNLQGTSTFGGTYNDLLAGLNPAFPQINLDANGDGDVFQEIMGLLTGNPADPTNNGYIYDFSNGTVAPDDDRVGDDLILTYLNYGTVNVFGGDFGATYQIDDNFSVTGSFSFVNKDKFELKGDDVIGKQYVFLNAPRFKSAVSVDHNNIANTGLGAGLTWRWQDAYRAESAVYVGDVKAANLVDMRISYRPNWSEGTLFSANLYNIFDYDFQRFPGTPEIGFYAMFKAQHTFSYNIGKKNKNKN